MHLFIIFKGAKTILRSISLKRYRISKKLIDECAEKPQITFRFLVTLNFRGPIHKYQNKYRPTSTIRW